MPLTTDELIDKAKDQRQRRRYEEALVSSIAATEADPGSAEASWQVALNRLSLGDLRNALPALEQTVELAPHFAAGWARYGKALLDTGATEAAQDAFENALEEDPDHKDALEALADIYYQQNKDNQDADEKELTILSRLECVGGLSSAHLNRIGALHYQNKNFFEAIKYWEKNVPLSDDPASLFNLGLVFNHPEVSQDADAVDMWRLTARRYPEFPRSSERIANVLPRLLTLANSALKQKVTLLEQDQWYSFYLNPFELLNLPEELDLDDLDAKAIQRLRKALLQEIDLEDGRISWVPGVQIDKSKAIGACEELNDDSKREFHWHVFQNRPLLGFLSRGEHTHFVVDKTDSPLETIELLEDQANGFREWLSEPFAKQFDLVLSKAIDQKNLAVLECLLDGRRWVDPPYADKCFESARRQVDRLLEPLRRAHERADHVKSTVESVAQLLDQGSLIDILNLLPTYFRDMQNEGPSIVRGIAISCYNSHSDPGLSTNVLQLSRRFAFKSAELNHRLDDDFKQIEELIRQERKHEVRLTRGDEKWEITKDGVYQGNRHFPVRSVVSARWGTIVTRENYGTSYDFLLAVKDASGAEIQFPWKTSSDTEKSQEYFGNLVNAALNYLFPSIAEKIDSRLKSGYAVQIGPCSITDRGIQFETKGWVFSDTHFVPWDRARLDVENGDLIISDTSSRKAMIGMSLRSIDNAPVLQFLAHMRTSD